MIKKIQFAGHAATFVHTDTQTIAIDPWLEGNPSCPDVLKNPSTLDLIALTHGHADHASDVVRLHQLTGAPVLATYELAMILVGEGVSQDAIIPVNKGGTYLFGSSAITLTHAEHSSSYDSATKGTLYAGEAGGILIRSGNDSLYHAGDTSLFSDLSLIKDAYKPSVALLPIGDRFTMGAQEAAHAAKLLGVRTAIPIHYKTFPLLAQTAEPFVTACRAFDIDVCELAPGATFEFSSR
jgi:L-ascorbate metabolism protein UlaG (beta-lactamase superfamily)